MMNNDLAAMQSFGCELDEVCVSFYPGLNLDSLSGLPVQDKRIAQVKYPAPFRPCRLELDEHERALIG